MNLKQTAAAGLMTLAAFGTLTFMPASADSLDSAAPTAAAPTQSVAALNSPETAQQLVWDMTYGDLTPPAADDEQPVASTENHDVKDMSMG